MTSSVGAGPSGNSISGFVVTAPTVVGQTGLVAKDEDILAEVNKLVAEEQELRSKLQRHDISESEEHERLRVIEMALDQCWDLLRQRRALRETGGDPREARGATGQPGRGLPELNAVTPDPDVVVVGGGHNGLVAAAYLARAGRRVQVLERLGHVGGAAVSAHAFDGVDARLSRYSYLVSLLPRRIVDDLGARVRLARRRYSSYTPDPATAGRTGLLIGPQNTSARSVLPVTRPGSPTSTAAAASSRLGCGRR